MRRFVGVISAIVASAVALAIVGVPVILQVERAGYRYREERRGHSARIGAELLQTPSGCLYRREHGDCYKFQGAHLHLSPQRRDATLRVRRERNLR